MQLSSLRCAMEEALLTNRTFVLPRHICIRPAFNIDAARIVNTSQTEMLLEDLFDLKAIIKALPKGIVFADSDDWKQTLAAAQDAQTLADARKKNPPKKEGEEGGGGGEEEEEDETPAQYLVVEDGSVSWRELRDVPDYAEAKIVHRKDDRPWRRVCATRFNGTAVIYHGPPFAKYIRDLAMQLSEKLGHFVFLHVRRHNTDIMRDDASYLRCRHLDRDTRVPAIRRHIWRLIPENSTLYIATDEVNPGFFSGLRQCYDSPPNGSSSEFPQPVSGLSFSERKFGPLAEVPPEEYDLGVAERAVQLSCRLTQRVQDQLRRAEDVARSKKDKSFVTVADWGVQAVVSWVLKQAYPDEPISMVAEEDTKELTGQAGVAVLQRLVQTVNECLAEAALVGIPPPQAPLTAVQVLQAISRGGSEGGAEGRHWVLDPVDGTLGFVRDDQYAVALALLQDGQLKVGALGCPNFPVRSGWLRHPHRFHRLTAKYFPPTKWHKGFVLKAKRGGGTWMESLVEIGRDGGALRAVPMPVRVSPVQDAALATFCEPVEKANSNQSFTAELADTLGISTEPLRVYSMAKYAAIARGDAEIFMKFAHGSYKEKIWDHAAGVIIVEEAGGVVTDAGGNPLDFSKGRFLLGLDRGIMATNGPDMHEQLLNTVDASWSASRL
ncbi:unnamed protein product [Closterium sp. Naga37s-1]|nr:unnamed protein product [Closterium sp. Naga37s-1]